MVVNLLNQESFYAVSASDLDAKTFWSATSIAASRSVFVISACLSQQSPADLKARRASRASSIFCIFLSILGQDMSWPSWPWEYHGPLGAVPWCHGAMVRSKAGLGYAFVNLCDPSFVGVLRSLREVGWIWWPPTATPEWIRCPEIWHLRRSFKHFPIWIHLTGPEMSRMGERWATGRFRGATILEDFRRLYQMGAHLQLWRTNSTTVVMVVCSSRTLGISLGISGDPGPQTPTKTLP